MQSSKNVNFKTLDELPVKYRSLFSSYPNFNNIQSKVFDNVMKTNNSMVVAAPTGSGKTGVLELGIVKLLMDAEKSGGRFDFKMVYVCPVKALCRERFQDWSPRFSQLGVSCIEITGDGGDYFDLQGNNLIITTPEKWDSLTRKWRDNAGLVHLIKLFMIDEVHLLSDNKRGPVLEAIVSRMKTISKTLNIDCVRFFAISATIYNIEDLATWLGSEGSPAFCYKFGSEARPVSLEKIVKGYPSNEKEAFRFDIQLSYKLKPLILEYSKGKPVLIFCSSRKSVLMTAKVLSQELTFHFSDFQKKNLIEGTASLLDLKLKELILHGVGYHHAGLEAEDRNTVQNLFVAGYLPILIATSTLAMGVNLPAHSVIIKSTKQFAGGQSSEYPQSSILQMIGRAGRPQFDTSAVAIIMTEEKNVLKYERLLDSKEIVESSLHLHLPEYLNSEIVLYTITDISVAMEWIRSTFLYVRALKNPRYYGFDANATPSKVEKSLETFCEKEINGLKKAGLIELKNGIDISPTADGRLMSHFYLSFDTFKIFLEVKENEALADILNALTDSHEFAEIQLRVNERKCLNELNKNKNRETIRFPLKGRIKSRSMKINVLIQACLGCLPIQDPSLNQESHRIVKIAERLAKCLSEYLSKKNFYGSLLNSLILAKCLHAKLWENSPYVCRQLERIGPTLCSLLSSCGKTTFEAIRESNPRDLERILNRAPPFGNVLQDAVRNLPKYDLKLEKFGNKIKVTVSLMNADAIREKSTAGDKHWLTLIVGDSDNNLLNFSKISDQTLFQNDWKVSVVQKGSPHTVTADLISETWVGIDASQTIQIFPIVKEEVEQKPKRKRKTTTQPTKTPKKPKEFDFIKDYVYKPKEKKKIEKPAKKNLLVPCFDVDIDMDFPEDFLEEPPKISLDNPDMSLMHFEECLDLTAEPEFEKWSQMDFINSEKFPPIESEEEKSFRVPGSKKEEIEQPFKKPEDGVVFPKFNEMLSVSSKKKDAPFVPLFEVDIDFPEVDVENEKQSPLRNSSPTNFEDQNENFIQNKEISIGGVLSDVDEEIQYLWENPRDLPGNFIDQNRSFMQCEENFNLIGRGLSGKIVNNKIQSSWKNPPENYLDRNRSFMQFEENLNLTGRASAEKRLDVRKKIQNPWKSPSDFRKNIVQQNRNLMQFEENLNFTGKTEFEKWLPVKERKDLSKSQCSTPKNFVADNRNLNSTPIAELVKKSPVKKKTSLQEIYEFLKQTPRRSASNQGN